MSASTRILRGRARRLLLVAIAASLAFAVVLQWDAIRTFDWRLSWPPFVVAVCLFAIGPFVGGVSFWIVLRDLAPGARLGPSLWVWETSFAARYVPSGALTVAVRLVERERLGASRGQMLSATVFEHLVSMAGAAAVCLAAFAASGRRPPVVAVAVLAAVLAVAGGARPAAAWWAHRRALARADGDRLAVVGMSALFAALALCAFGWLVAGTAAWVFVEALVAGPSPSFLFLLAVYTFAWVLLTGATGRLGRCLAEELARAGCDLELVVRASSPEAARDRVRQKFAPDVSHRQLSVVCGDVSAPWLGLRARDRRRLSGSVDVILHAAATTSFNSPLETAWATNVAATRNVLAFAERAPRLWRLAHVSTAFVAGRRTGRILEPELEHDYGFLNTYQQSKYEAELLLARYRDFLPIVVFRPSIVLDGPSSLQRRSAFRFAFELVRRGLMPAVPGSAATPVDLVTEGDAARAMAGLLFLPAADGVYHVAGGERAPRLGDIVAPFGVRYLAEEQFAWEVSKWRHERPRLAPVYDELASFIFELGYPKVFDTSRSESALGEPVQLEDPLASLLGGEPSHMWAEAGAPVR